MEAQKTPNSKTVLGKKEQSWRNHNHSPWLQTIYKATVHKTDTWISGTEYKAQKYTHALLVN